MQSIIDATQPPKLNGAQNFTQEVVDNLDVQLFIKSAQSSTPISAHFKSNETVKEVTRCFAKNLFKTKGCVKSKIYLYKTQESQMLLKPESRLKQHEIKHKDVSIAKLEPNIYIE